MKTKIISGLVSVFVMACLMPISIRPAFGLGELPVATPTPNLSTPIPTAIPTPEITPSTTLGTSPTPLPSIFPSDTTPPVISGVAEASLFPTDATIVWTTDELAVSTLEYGTTTSYGLSATLPVTALLAHTGVILNLNPSTKYYYCIHATDLFGNTSNSCGHSFTTAQADTMIDTTPPTVSDVSISSLTTNSVTINWSTHEVANAEVEYGTTVSYGLISEFDLALATTHSINLTGLEPNTEYHYRVRSIDQVGNVSLSTDNVFTTSPTIVETNTNLGSATVNFSSIEVTNITSSSVTITWNTDIPADSQVEYGADELLGSFTQINSALSNSHSATITNLQPNTNYIFRLRSKPLGSALATVSDYHEFDTLAEPVFATTPANIISVGTADIATTNAKINISTDANTTALVEYGISTSYGVSTADISSGAAHSINLSDLVPGTAYHYRAKVTNIYGDITFSGDHTFTTASLPQSTNINPPEALITLTVVSKDQSSVTLTWSVGSTNLDVAQEYDIRYSTNIITPTNFDSAAQAQLTPIFYPDLEPNGARRTYVVAGLQQQGVTYYFALKSKYGNSDWSSISNMVSAEIFASNEPGEVPITNPTVTNVSGQDGQVSFNFDNPDESSYVRTVIIEKEGGYPSTPEDGKIVYEGTSGTFTETNLTNGKEYYYSIYAYDHAKHYSNGVHISLAPNQGITETKINKNPVVVEKTTHDHFVRDLKIGSKDIEVEHLQQILAADGGLYPESLITGYFGALTQRAVKKFQAKHSLPQTGVLDAQTRAKLNTLSGAQAVLSTPEDAELFTKDLRFGQKGKGVEALQEYLSHEGSYPGGKITGEFDQATRNAVVTFQKKYGIKPAVGYVGYKTRHQMQALSGL